MNTTTRKRRHRRAAEGGPRHPEQAERLAKLTAHYEAIGLAPKRGYRQ
jgi:hypothetical protein